MWQRKHYEVVIMAAGRGSRLGDLAAAIDRPLIPVGNRPAIYYVLRLVEDFGFEDAHVVCRETSKSILETMPEKYSMKLKVKCLALPDENDLGTADSLRLLADNLTAPLVIVLSCDLLCSTAVLRRLVNQHLASESSLTALYSRYQDGYLKLMPGEKKWENDNDFVGIEEKHGRLVLVNPRAGVSESIRLSRRILKAYGNITFSGKVWDAHAYVMKNWLVDYLSARNFAMLKSEFIPHVVEQQFVKPRKSSKRESESTEEHRAALPAAEFVSEDDDTDEEIVKAEGDAAKANPLEGFNYPFVNRREKRRRASKAVFLSDDEEEAAKVEGRESGIDEIDGEAAGDTQNDDPKSEPPRSQNIFDYVREKGAITRVRKLAPMWEYAGNPYKKLLEERSKLRCYSCVVNGDERKETCVRAHNLMTYLKANLIARDFLSLWEPKYQPIHETAEMPGWLKTQLLTSCTVGEGSIIAGKVVMKNVVVGARCKIGDKAKIFNCVLLDDVVVKEGVSLQDSVVCSNAVIGENADIKNCVISFQFEVPASTKGKDELMTSMNLFSEEGEDDDDMEDDDDDDEEEDSDA